MFKLCPWGSLLLATLWPLTFSSGERPRALCALLFYVYCYINRLVFLYVQHLFKMTFKLIFFRDGNKYQNDIRIFVLRYSNTFKYTFLHLFIIKLFIILNLIIRVLCYPKYSTVNNHCSYHIWTSHTRNKNKWTKNGVYIRNIYILFNISQPLPSYFKNIW